MLFMLIRMRQVNLFQVAVRSSSSKKNPSSKKRIFQNCYNLPIVDRLPSPTESRVRENTGIGHFLFVQKEKRREEEGGAQTPLNQLEP